jgi:hypothetical protein
VGKFLGTKNLAFWRAFTKQKMSSLETIKEKEAKSVKRRNLLDLTSEKLASLTLVGKILVKFRRYLQEFST